MRAGDSVNGIRSGACFGEVLALCLGRMIVDRALPLRLNKEHYTSGTVPVYVCHVTLHSFSAVTYGTDVSSVFVFVLLCAHLGRFRVPVHVIRQPSL